MRSAPWSLLLFAGAALANVPSQDGTCGAGTGYTCWGSWFGNCCGENGKCGSSPDACATGCQKDFGFCSDGMYDFTPRQAPTLGGYGGYGGYGDDEEDYDDEDCECDEWEDETSSAPTYASMTPPPISSSTSLPYSANSSVPFPTGSGSISISYSSSAPYPSGSGSSVPIPSGSGSQPPYLSSSVVISSWLSTGTAPASSIPLSTGPSSTSVPLSTAPPSSSIPLSTGTSPVSSKPSSGTIGTSSTSTSKTCSSTPIPTSYLPDCVPCSGPGQKFSPNDPYCGLTVNDNSYENTPITCRVVTYEFDVTDVTVSPDGVERPAMVVNGQLPGPLLEANWGDTVVVKVTNSLKSKNGTSIHFHGIRQSNNSENDGVPSITQCPIAPGDTFTYVWVAENYGTSWYHSHYAIQAWEGVLGPMIIHGPHSSNDFDEDKGAIIVQDWSHFTVDSRYDLAQNATINPATNATYGGPVVMDSGLINGLNVWGDDGSSTQTGSRWETTFEPGKKYLLRIINTAIQSTYKFYIDGHDFTVISADFVPIKPYKTNILNINIGKLRPHLIKPRPNPC